MARKSVWDGPVAVDYDLSANELADCLRRAAPVGRHTHDQVETPFGARRGRRAELPRRPGRMRDKLSNTAWYRKTQKGIRISFFDAYTLAQDQGAIIPPVRHTGKGRAYMHWGPGNVYRNARRGYVLPAQNFIEKGVNEWTSSRTGIGVTWVKGRNNGE